MIRKDDYSQILQRIKHIKSLFAFGEGILPFLEELFLFLREVTPLLNDVSESIMNTTGMVPGAALELGQAVEETSDATHRIMDHVESILNNLDNIEKKGTIEGEENTFDGMRGDALAIMNALQFHDIVSQKLLHVQKVLAEIQQKMLNLFVRVYDLDIEADVKENILSSFGINVDELNRMMTAKIEVTDKLTDDTPHPDKRAEAEAAKFSQTDIDDLFG